VVVNNASNFPDQLDGLGIASATSNPGTLGQKATMVLLEELTTAGKTTGTILIGNPYPQNANQQGVVVGGESAISAWNASNKTDFKWVELADNSGTSLPQGVSLWEAKIRELGSSLVGTFGIADSSIQAAVRAFKGLGYAPGHMPLVGTDIETDSLAELGEGWLLALVDAGFYMQGWLPVMWAWQALERGFYASGAVDCSGSAITQKTLPGYNKANNLQITLGKDYGVLLE